MESAGSGVNQNQHELKASSELLSHQPVPTKTSALAGTTRRHLLHHLLPKNHLPSRLISLCYPN